MQLALVTFLVRDYDEAIAFFCGQLGFALVEDTVLSEDKRWVRVAPKGAAGATLLLAKAATPEQDAAVGRQTGGRVGFFLNTDDFDVTYGVFLKNNVRFREAPRMEPYGKVAVFEDLYGNLWDLIEPAGDH